MVLLFLLVLDGEPLGNTGYFKQSPTVKICVGFNFLHTSFAHKVSIKVKLVKFLNVPYLFFITYTGLAEGTFNSGSHLRCHHAIGIFQN